MEAEKGTFLLLVAALIETSFQETCPPSECVPPKCYCRTVGFPLVGQGIHYTSDVPQFVMLTFDDAVSDVNMPFYRELLTTTRTNPDSCRIRATFFVSHEYTNYVRVNELYLNGNEIASHSCTHLPNTDEWKRKSEIRYKEEMVGLRKHAEKYALIPPGKVKGARSPFLQTSGDPYFTALRKNDFLYDSTMPSRKYTHPPMWPYTLDFGFDQDCVIEPCPKQKYPGFWEVPLVNLWKLREVTPGKKEDYPCSMADACLPYPETAADTKDFLSKNFRRHYDSNKAPFPVFLHEAWLKEPERKKGYLEFVDYLLTLPDVYIVTIQEVIAYMMNRLPLQVYHKQKCPKPEGGTGCRNITCIYPPRHEPWVEKYLTICADECPAVYPWFD